MDNREIIDFICKRCGNNKSYLSTTEFSQAGECTSCGELTFYKKIKDNPNKVIEPEVKCPYCGSLLTKKITKASKVGGIALFGIFAVGRSTKEWHCTKCNSDF